MDVIRSQLLLRCWACGSARVSWASHDDLWPIAGRAQRPILALCLLIRVRYQRLPQHVVWHQQPSALFSTGCLQVVATDRL